ncbi:auxilin-related protein 1 isoform X2 [Amborella trichopoda]|uniref:J domain-containing protein n=1 Tax=Amborella trichopoda TaxID=13333 RepID=W1NHL9_AMBTC|nr:auxilin-related protein 1 isoform X2 [Amborella trichopoda]ERM94674.1 hypothetical protein AMTR_s00011p00222440 [Amborella trichopoda]|eukprot:XP_006878529.1 auxilin-related protein 1 isoform X2 [Amborella trichopoda]
MADLQHRSHGQKPHSKPPATLAPRKPHTQNGNGTGNNTLVYDDVFGGPPKYTVSSFAPKIEGYDEIFRNFSNPMTSDVPFLEVPVHHNDDDDEVFGGLGNSGPLDFLYEDVFGENEDRDFAVPYEELFFPEAKKTKKSRVVPESKSWQQVQPVQSPASSERTDNPFYSLELDGSSKQSIGAVRESNLLYQMTNQMGRENVICGTTHLHQLNDAPRYTVGGKALSPLHKTKIDKSPPRTVHSLNGNLVLDGETMEVDQSGRVMSNKSLGNGLSSSGKNVLKEDPKQFQGKLDTSEEVPSSVNNQLDLCDFDRDVACIGDRPFPHKSFITVAEINLQTKPTKVPPPSRPPPKLGIRMGDLKAYAEKENLFLSMLSSRPHQFESVSGASLNDEAVKHRAPPSLDYEESATLDAAASAAAMKEAMERAEVKLKLAKESRERKRDILESHTKPVLKEEIKYVQVNEMRTCVEPQDKETITQVSCERAEKEMESCDKEENHKSASASPADPVCQEKGSGVKSTEEFTEKEGSQVKSTEEFTEKEETNNVGVVHVTKKGEKQEKEVNSGKRAVVMKEDGRKSNDMHKPKEDVDNKKKIKFTQVADELEENKKISKATKNARDYEQEENGKKSPASEDVCGLAEYEKKSVGALDALEHDEKEKKLKPSQETCDREQNEETLKAYEDGGREENKKTFEALQDKEKVIKTTYEAFEYQEAVRRKKNTQEALQKEDRKKEELENGRRLRDIEEEKERLRKLEEETEREREREKDRVAVEKENQKARERAERAAVERVTAEARERAFIEARERAEKVAAEAREKALADKASSEARQRAAMDRATAEARERALERALVEKAAAEARARAERAAAERFAASSRERQLRENSNQSEPQDTAFDSQSGEGLGRFPASDTADSVEAGGESAERRKARLERHQRTKERAAKALAEKNARDILVQREQAERQRLAESLDADVKRWSSGKEGNLRALLSTLQYILWPDSGWQPIPLTEVITAAAVKKAYRKATLCVHPDKMQQKGATLPQKYISEKVFDLLKDAWNKFNSEEH